MITKEYLQQELRRRIDGIKPCVITTTDLTIGEMRSILVLVDALNDYEKKYNHALEVVRELQKDWASTQNRAAKEIELAFPELCESEDERIRKSIVATIEQCPDDFLNPKNRNPAWSEEDEIHVRSIFGDFRQDVVPDEEDQDWLKKKLESLRLQPKQEWSGEDERILKGIIGKIDHDQTYGVSKDEMLNFLKKL